MEETEIATIAGGCFWCTEAIFKRLKGVISVVPGYTGGRQDHPTYQEVCSGNTGHAEAIQITFHPKIISYEKILEIFFHLHDPTTLNRQGNDVGTQYRSAIFYHDDKQKIKAQNIKKQIGKEKLYPNPIVTQIVAYKVFFPAEDYHHDYYAKNSYQPYCQYVIDPKIHKLLEEFKNEVA